MRLEVIQNHYEHITKTPFYLFSFPILMAGLIAIFINYNSKTQKEKAIFSASPIVGDVYTITKEENNKTTYYFLRIARISGDTVVAYHNKYEYNGYVSGMNNEDFFVKDDLLYFLKPELKQMVDKMEINSIDRVYGDEEGFNRIR